MGELDGGMATIEQPLASRRFEHLVLDFLAYLEFERGLSRNTLEAYRSDLLQFGRFLDARGLSAVEAEAADVSDFLSELAAGRLTPAPEAAAAASAGAGIADPLAAALPVRPAVRPPAEPKPASPATVHRKAACLRSFYRHLRREGVRESDPTATLSAPRRSRKLPQVLSRGEVEKLLSQPRGSEPAAAARPRAARADVRLWPARLGGDRPRGARRRRRGARAARARQGLQGAARADRRRRPACARALPAQRASGARQGRAPSRTCSSTSAAGR